MPRAEGLSQRHYVLLPRGAPGRSVLISLLIGLCCGCLAGEAGGKSSSTAAVSLPTQETVSLGSDDTLEFVLQLPLMPRDAAAAQPEVRAWMLGPEEQAPAADAPTTARALVWPSPRPGQWLVHLRGITPPPAREGKWDLLVRWKVGQAGKPVLPLATQEMAGETRLRSCVAFKAEAADAVLLMDGSLSMDVSDPQKLRVEAAREFIAEARLTRSIGRVALIQFDDKSRLILGLTPVTENFEAALEKLDARGETDIDGGIRHALELLTKSSQAGTPAPQSAAGGSIVLLTDGKQEPGVYGNAHEAARKLGVAVHTLALGRDADRPLLRRIAEETGGTFADAARDRDLSLAYAAIASRIARARTLTVAALASDGAALKIPVDGSCRSLALGVTSLRAGTLNVQGPAGQAWASPAQLSAHYFVELPAAGQWLADWKPVAGSGPLTPPSPQRREGNGKTPSPQGGEENEALLASARTTLYPVFFRTDPQPGTPLEIDTDESCVALSLCENGEPLRDANVQVSLKLEGHAPVSMQLYDDGQHGGGAAGDGIYAAFLPPFDAANTAAPYPENAAGSLLAVVTGTRQGQRQKEEFRREIEAAAVFHRHEGPALIVSGALDFGRCFPGEGASAEFQLRVRGTGGNLVAQVRQAGKPVLPDLRDTSRWLKLDGLPPALQRREHRAVRAGVTLPEFTEPGVYGGVLELHLSGTEPVRVPWRVECVRPALDARPAIDLGAVSAGGQAEASLRLKTGGGVLTVFSAALEEATMEGRRDAGAPDALLPSQYLSVSEYPTEAVTCTPSGVEVKLGFAITAGATAGPLQRWLVLRDFARREVGRVEVRAQVLPQHLNVDAQLAIGPVETGDSASRPVLWKWAGGQVERPFTLKLLPGPGNLSDRLESLSYRVSLAPAELAGGNGQSRLTLTVPADAPEGEIYGWLALESGPVLVLRRWSAVVVKPRQSATPAALDFGPLFAGQSRTLKLALHAHTAKPLAASATVQPLAKPRMPGISLPAEALALKPLEGRRDAGAPKEIVVPAGQTGELALELNIPDSAQDGLYRSKLELSSRLGDITVPISLTVVNEVTAAPFHTAPSVLVLRFDEDGEAPTGKVHITSHRDEDLALALEMKPYHFTSRAPAQEPGEGAAAPAAHMLPYLAPTAPTAQPPEEQGQERELHSLDLKLSLPARATIELSLQARPDAQAGEISTLNITGEGEEHVIEVRIERPLSAQGLPSAEPPRLLTWMLLGLLMALLAGAVLVHFSVRRPWVRYVAYSIIFHLAFLPWALGQQKVLQALPATVEIKILEAQESLGMDLSDQQVRRLEALRSGEEAAPPSSRAPANLPAPAAVEVDLPQPAGANAGTPGPTALGAAQAPADATQLAAAPKAQRGPGPAAPEPDAPLKTEALQPEPGPAAAAAEPAKVQARAFDAPAAAGKHAAPPAMPAPQAPQAAPAPRADLPVTADMPEPASVAPQAGAAAAARPEQQPPAVADAPLAAEPLAAPQPAAAAQRNNLAAADRNAPVIALAGKGTGTGSASSRAVLAADVIPSQAAPARGAGLEPVAAGMPDGEQAAVPAAGVGLAVLRAGRDAGAADDVALDAGPSIPAAAPAAGRLPAGQGTQAETVSARAASALGLGNGGQGGGDGGGAGLGVLGAGAAGSGAAPSSGGKGLAAQSFAGIGDDGLPALGAGGGGGGGTGGGFGR
ncbi:MAG: vWA domain-containing protein, partial [Planctomycetota bacterium]